MKARGFTLLLLLLSPLLFAQYKPWLNFYNFTYGAKARSMGSAFTAVADDLTASFWNPAGLADLRSPEFYLSYKSLAQSHETDLQERVMTNDTKLYSYNFSCQLNQIDFFSVSAPAFIMRRNWTFALSYYRYIPYGLKGTAQEVLTFLRERFDPQIDTVTFTGSEGIDVLAFSVSAALTNHFSLGATLQQFFDSGSRHLISEDSNREYHSQFSEKLQGRNLIAGLLFSPFSFLRLGFTWHSGLKSNFDSTLLTWEVNRRGDKLNLQEASCQARVVIPEQFALGALLKPAAWLDCSVEYSRLDWQKGSIENYYDFEAVLPYPQKNNFGPQQKNIRNLRLGVEARLPLSRWLLHLRGGWSAEHQLYADVNDQAVVVSGLAGGLGCEFSRNLLLEIAYQRQEADWPEKGYFSKAPDVDSHFRANVFSLSLTYRFGHIFKE